MDARETPVRALLLICLGTAGWSCKEQGDETVPLPSAACQFCPRQIPELQSLCLGPAICYWSQADTIGDVTLRRCDDETQTWTDLVFDYDVVNWTTRVSCPETKPGTGTPCRHDATNCLVCTYLNGCGKPSTTLYCDQGSWRASPDDVLHPQLEECAPATDTVSTPSRCQSPPRCTCTYPSNYYGSVICGYGNQRTPEDAYHYPADSPLYWGDTVTCSASDADFCYLGNSFSRCASDPSKVCCASDDTQDFTVACVFPDVENATELRALAQPCCE
jgi:hypothetical protein